MKTEFFPNFLRAQYPHVDIENKEAIEIGEKFKQYLKEKFKGEEEKLNTIWNISPIKIIINMNHPLKMKGYEPAFIYHFTEFIEKEKSNL